MVARIELKGSSQVEARNRHEDVCPDECTYSDD
jgi:hypothetical protein